MDRIRKVTIKKQEAKTIRDSMMSGTVPEDKKMAEKLEKAIDKEKKELEKKMAQNPRQMNQAITEEENVRDFFKKALIDYGANKNAEELISAITACWRRAYQG